MKKKRELLVKLFKDVSEKNIYKVCASHGFLPKYAETIYLFLNNTIEETADILNIDTKTVTRRIDKVIERLSYESLFVFALKMPILCL